MFPPSFKKINRTEEDFVKSFTDKYGEQFIIRPADNKDFELILRMYDLFEPKESAQGLPPADPERRKNLIRKIVEESLNIIAENGPAVVGHACLIDIKPGVRSELEIVIHQDWQGHGLGSAMVALLVKVARSCNYQSIWLSVDAANLRAIHIYQKCGFIFTGPLGSEREMELQLK